MKTKTLYACQTCGAQFPKWVGQCAACSAWNTLVEESFQAPAKSTSHYAQANACWTRLDAVSFSANPRQTTGLSEFDRVLGGGLVQGSAILIGGDPGIGKSTLLLQALTHLSQTHRVMYVTGEESPEQVALRAKRLELSSKELWLFTETNIENILAKAQIEKPQIMVIDSIQTMFTSGLNSAAGSVGQVRESAMQLVRYAKQQGMILLIVGHVTKEGHLAGPRVLEHMVDTVLYFENETDQRFRLLRAVKNRFGAVNELGLFAMTEKGLRAVAHPSALFLSQENVAIPGRCTTSILEGSRPFLIEIQALVDDASHNQRRLALGLDTARMAMLIAIFHKHTGVSLQGLDVYANVVGGLKIQETAADLPLLLAMNSSLRNQAILKSVLVFGEVGLGGEIRPVNDGQARLKVAAQHGFTHAIIPKLNQSKQAIPNLICHPVSNIADAKKIIEEMS